MTNGQAKDFENSVQTAKPPACPFAPRLSRRSTPFDPQPTSGLSRHAQQTHTDPFAQQNRGS
eukprot:1376311-Rhodomonas_salina.1